MLLYGSMGKRTMTAVLVGLLVVAAAGAGGWWWYSSAERQRDEEARAALRSFATSWQGRSFDKSGLRFAGSTPAEVDQEFTSATSGLGAGPVRVEVASLERDGKTADAELDVTWTLPGSVPWTYRTPVSVGETADGWAVQPAASGSWWHPQLKSGDKLTATRTQGRRGDLLDANGEPLMPLGKVYPVQLDPARATSATAAALEKLVDEPSGSLVKKLESAQKAGSKSPIAVITYRQSDFDDKRAELDALKGVIYPAREQPLARTRGFGQPMLGSYGPVSAELVEKSKGRYAAGDYAGLSGLQGQYDSVLAGTPGVTVTSSASPDRPLFEKATTDGKDVQLTLDPTVQEAAEAALARTGSVPSALVAVDVESGDVLASANSPSLGFDRAITGQYPPGSTFKVASTYALLSKGVVTPTTRVSCPKTFVVDGRTIRNYEGGALSNPTFGEDFANSCNTAFVQLAAKLGDSDLAAAARALGIGAGWEKSLGVGGAFPGKVPENTGATDKAAATIGQGRNLTSPLSLAVMAGSVARGSFVPPALVTVPAPAETSREPKPLDPQVTSQLRALMGRVVTEGSAEALKDAPGGVVRGKTGTAEYGTKNPPETHAWFVGYQGDVAFAVLVEKGKSGGTAAAPVAKDFLTRLAAG
jgi:cell division protein FtsI/penicillin-binding protein 2